MKNGRTATHEWYDVPQATKQIRRHRRMTLRYDLRPPRVMVRVSKLTRPRMVLTTDSGCS